MNEALAQEPHAQRLVQIEVIYPKQLDVLFQLRKEAPFNPNPPNLRPIWYNLPCKLLI